MASRAAASSGLPTKTKTKPKDTKYKSASRNDTQRNTNIPAFLSVAPKRSFSINDHQFNDRDENNAQLARVERRTDTAEQQETKRKGNKRGGEGEEEEETSSDDFDGFSDQGDAGVEQEGSTRSRRKGKRTQKEKLASDEDNDSSSSSGNDEDDDEDEDSEHVWTEEQERVSSRGPIRPQAHSMAPPGANHAASKDEEEKELEALIFGNSSGFRESLHQLSKRQRDGYSTKWDAAAGSDVSGSGPAAEEEKSDLEGVGDDDLFFVDAQGNDSVAGQTHVEQASEEQGETAENDGEGGAAWEDSDDQRVEISLANVARLRKLRVAEDEDVVNGKEYVRRLRGQYLKLNPRPQWVDDAAGLKRGRKRRKTSDGEEVTDSSDSDVQMDGDDTFSGHRPLADLLRDATSLTRTGPKLGKRKLRPEVIDIQRTKHIANNGPSAITSLQIHPSLPLLIASGPSSKMDLYHLHDNAPTYTTHLTSLWMKNHPFTTTLFHPLATDTRIFLSARRRYFHVWNLASGQIETVTRMYGHADEQRSYETFKIAPTGAHIAFIGSARKGGGVLNFLDANTLQWIAQARVESRGGIADFAWWRDGKGVTVAGKNGEVTEWNLEERCVVARWRDEGAVGTTTLALGGKSKSAKTIGGDAYVAIGSSAGIVNVYSRAAWFAAPAVFPSSSTDTGALSKSKKKHRSSSTTSKPSASQILPQVPVEENSSIPLNPKPLRALDQLTTPISHLTFSPDGQVLCMASRWKKDALRLVHMPSCTVYRNWPTDGTPLGRISAVCWGDVAAETDNAESVLKLVVGNEAGRIAAWEVRGD